MGGFDNTQQAFAPQPVAVQAPAGLQHRTGINRQAAKSFTAACIARALAVIAAVVVFWAFVPWSIGALIIAIPIAIYVATRYYDLDTRTAIILVVMSSVFSFALLLNFDSVTNSLWPQDRFLRLFWQAHILLRGAIVVLPVIYLATFSRAVRFFLHQLEIPQVRPPISAVGAEDAQKERVEHDKVTLDLFVTKQTGPATATTRRAEVTLPMSLDMMRQFAASWAQGGGGVSERRAKDLGISRDRFNQFRDELIAAGLATWRTKDPRQGWALTAAGRGMMRKLAQDSEAGESAKALYIELPPILPEDRGALAVPPEF